MPHEIRSHQIIRRAAWLLGFVPIAAGVSALHAQQNSTTRAGAWEQQLKAANRRTQPGDIVFHDPSPKPSNHNLTGAHYVGVKTCAGCHGALNSTRPHHTIIDEWSSDSNPHAKDAATLAGNLYNRTIADGVTVNGVKSCAVCHTTGAPTFDQPQTATPQNGFDPSKPFNDYLHNTDFLRVQCENCHGPGSQHVLSGGNPAYINRVPDPKETCMKCHTNMPNEKGNALTAAVSDGQLALYSSSLAHSHNAGGLITGTGGYEYSGETYDQGHNFPHTKIATTCVTCHMLRDKKSPILDHSSIAPKIEACRNCHADAKNVPDVDHYPFMENRQNTITQLLIRLGGDDGHGNPNGNGTGGLLGGAADKTSVEYKRARWNYFLVLNDGSRGVHNYDYAAELLLTSISHAPAQVGTAGPAGAGQ